ncbi:PilC/PilY family type IV pilus protein [uncultured Pseudoteredinibacter sp.]|uniref:pilus assembly protein n=1 Tax=uncultured Pseudoteredinibacter sp. TaxID=1641701 RepID=UPI002621C53D|nr:PilC/PilY family type IV pilus protein [uncultured Pseudoteredinibacter sp.]
MEILFKKATVITAAIMLLQGVAQAAPGPIASQPLFVGKTPQSNIMFLVDDSGSMDWEYLITNYPAYYEDTARYRCTAINAMWYNASLYREKAADPANDTLEKRLAYTPWRGVDANGNEYTNRTLNTASDNPYASPTSYRDINNWYFFEWNDAIVADGKGNGRYDDGECDTSARVYAKNLPAEQQIDFANWYTYYRKREYVAKRALSQIILDSNARVGLATLHNNQGVGVPIKDIDDLSTPINYGSRTNKNDLLKRLFKIDSSGGTPLRRSLERVGKYFHQSESTPSQLFGGLTPSSPILSSAENGACQQNFAVVMSDGYWNGSNPNVGNADNDGNSDYDGDKYGDSYSNTLADVAMHYYEGDLAPGLPDLVGPKLDPSAPVPDPLLNRAQHLVSYTVAFGVNGSLSEPPANGNWPEPVRNQASTVDDMLHAAYNSRGEFLSAKNPQELIQRLSDAINSIKSKVGSSSGLALNSSSISSDSAVFKAVFSPEKSWSGDLIRQKITTVSVGGVEQIRLQDEWSAAEKLKARDPADRQILTFNGSRGVPFRFPNNYVNPDADTEISTGQVADLLFDAPHESAANQSQINDNKTYGERLLNYLRGEHTYERGVANTATITSNFNKVFRDRVGERLGDIAHSSPIYVARPSENYPDKIEGEDASKSYVAFAKSKANRREMVYVGANDGMLHGFDADTGEERFAYVPSIIFNENAAFGLHYLSSTNYSHIPFVDGAITVRDVYVDGAWKSYLVGALRGGGRGIYVLDVTNPDQVTETNAASKVVKEFTHNDLGFTFSDPVVVRMNDGRWAAVMGNGYNPGPNSDGHAKLFIVYLDDKTPSYRIIETKNSGDADLIRSANCEDVNSDCNGMSTPLVLDLDGDSIADRAYAGDLHGNLWTFDISDEDGDDWDVAHMQGGKNQPLFTACSQAPCEQNGKVANRQPITSMPRVKSHRFRLAADYKPSLLIYFGTGQFISNGDQADTSTQSAYGVWDRGIGGLTRGNLQGQTVVNQADSRTLSNNAVDYDDLAAEAGWRIDLPNDRERIINSFVVGSSVVVFGSIIPDAATCEGSPSGYLMAVDAFTGGQPPFQVFDRASIGSVPISGIKLDGMPGEISTLEGSEGTTKVLIPTQDGELITLDLLGSGSRARQTSWTTLK